MKTILITGGTGFIGSHFLINILPKYPEILFVNIDILSSSENFDRIPHFILQAKNYIFEQCDITDRNALEKIFQKYSPTDIIHFAAETHVDIAIKNPELFTKTNIFGTENLLVLHKKFNLKRFHYISTDEVYGDAFWGKHFSENSLLFPSNPYSASKAAAEMLIMAYGRTFLIDYVITRSANNFWPYQNLNNFLPVVILHALKNQKIPIYGDGLQMRDWLYVKDHIEAIWNIFLHAPSKNIYNIATGKKYKNIDIVKKILHILGKPEMLVEFVADRPWHDRAYSLDITKITSELQWSPKYSFEEGLLSTISFYENLLKVKNY